VFSPWINMGDLREICKLFPKFTSLDEQEQP
jgi:hypothetical protein